MKRRDFLRRSSSVVVSSVAGAYGARAYSRVNSSLANLLQFADESDRVLVLVFMNGGNDGLNTLVPLSQMSKLSQSRPQVLLPEGQLLELPGTGLAMHPSLADFKELYDEGKLLAVQNVGYENPNLSHFRSTDIWMSASASDELITNGWMGRYLDHQNPNYPFDYPNEDAPHPLAIEIGRSTSLLFQGPSASMGLAIHDPSFFYDLLDSVEAPVPDGPAGERIQLIRILAKQSELYASRVKAAAERVQQQNPYPNLGLADQLKIVARLIAGGLQTKLYLVQLNGFDTHDSQVSRSNVLEGEHANLLRELSRSIKAFTDDCEFLGISERVLGMTFSEFGRRIRANNSFGTDHGTAAPLFFFGDNINPGIIGENPEVPAQATVRDNLPHEFEFRQLYASVFRQWFCLDKTAVDSILGDFETLPVIPDHLSCAGGTVSATDLQPQLLKIYPSPAQHEIFVELLDREAIGPVQIIDVGGRVLGNIPSRQSGALLRFEVTDLPPGRYWVRMVQKDRVVSESFIKL